MKCTTDRSYCGAVAPNKVALSVISLSNKVVKAPYCLLKPVKKRTELPILWLLVLCCLLACNSTMADDVRWEVSHHYLQQLAYGQHHLLSDPVNSSNLALIVKEGREQLQVSSASRTGWLLAFEPLEFGAENILLVGLSAVSEVYQENVLQEVGQYSGWGAKVGYRVALSERLFSSVQLGGFNWRHTLIHQTTNSTRWDEERTGISPYAGLGLAYRFSDEASVRLNWLHFELSNGNLDSLAIKVDYRF
ncbi:hypothetical protein HQQ94_19130 [Shewanella sp. VB17]|uniref:outer membrane beta-barrel protein n=1 Tax=Shewanella sp. VB17 TaxID=2739432 RepID=UPI0015660876|nr:outer membrane beta-barrel protein [Shewanella sp. VB17]NRD75297.1 hypothetical protein [Shewanella sp. VB17]